MILTLRMMMFDSLINRFDQYCAHYIATIIKPGILKDAIAYSLHNGGKRLRPLLVYNIGLDLGLNLSELDCAALSVECMHTYSLIHDDLPAMDNDDFRRGKPSCHKKFTEATAILAGDCLQNMAFGVLCQQDNLSSKQQLAMIKTLHETTCESGLVGGQIIDLGIEKIEKNAAEIERLHLLKTATLFEACVTMPCIIKNLATKETSLLKNLSHKLGIAFQIQDDIADFAQDLTNNNRLNHAHYPSIASSQSRIYELLNECNTICAQLPFATNNLAMLQKYMLPEFHDPA
jgi:geranylgeranyl pyrophosphate synthase